MRIAVCQMHTGEDKRENVRHACEMIAKAAQGADIVVLPEMFCCPYQNDSFVKNAEAAGGFVYSEMSAAARDNRVFLIAGSMPEEENGKLYNTSFVFSPDGRQLARHRKMFLFDIDIPGGQYFRESDTFSPGEEVTVFETPWGKIGLCICFDMRFPELSREMVRRGAEVIAAPAAFNMTTGPAHWELMFRSRAVDNQVYTVGAAPARDESAGYVSYGNSIVCDPWGTVLGRCGAAEEIMLCRLDMEQVKRIRAQLPLLSSLRGKEL